MARPAGSSSRTRTARTCSLSIATRFPEAAQQLVVHFHVVFWSAEPHMPFGHRPINGLTSAESAVIASHPKRHSMARMTTRSFRCWFRCKDTRSPGRSGCSGGCFEPDVRTPRYRGVRCRRHGYPQGNRHGFSVRQSSLASLFSNQERQGRETEQWQGELTALVKLGRAGWTKRTLQPGDSVVVSSSPAKNGAHTIWIKKLIGPDGKPLQLFED